MTGDQLDLFALLTDDAPGRVGDPVGSPALGFMLALETEMRAVDADPARRRERALEETWWALIRALQAEHTLTLVEASDAYLDGRRHELATAVGSKADSALYGWLNPTPSIVRTVWQLAEATALLRLDAPAAAPSRSRSARIVADGNADGGMSWRAVAAWWQPAIRRWPRRPTVHRSGQWVAWCERLPPGAPRGSLTVPAPAPGRPLDYEEAVGGLAGWWRQAAWTGRRWVCPHGWTHHPTRNPRDPLSCHGVRDADACDRCCVTHAPYLTPHQ